MIPPLFAAGISTDESTFWAYRCGSSLASAVLAVIHDYPTAFLLPMDGYSSMDVIQVSSNYGRFLETACEKGCIYVPPSHIITKKRLSGDDVKRIMEG